MSLLTFPNSGNTYYFRVIFIANAPKNSPEVIYHVTHTSQIETAPRELKSVEICNRIDGCPVVEGVCESCEIVKR